MRSMGWGFMRSGLRERARKTLPIIDQNGNGKVFARSIRRFYESIASPPVFETRKMNLFTAVNDAMRVALRTDDEAIVLGEDVGFGGVFRCSVGLQEEFGRDRYI